MRRTNARSSLAGPSDADHGGTESIWFSDIIDHRAVTLLAQCSS